MAEVVVVQEVLPHYRVAFFDRLDRRLARVGVRLRVLHSVVTPEVARQVEGSAWAERVPVRHVTTPAGSLVWQQVREPTRSADLVVVEHANRMLANYLLLLRASRGRQRLAFWGHGANLQTAHARSAAERFKARTARAPHWWFAYTEGSAERVRAAGFPASRICVVDNSIDTDAYPARPEKRPATCVFVGTLHRYKRVELLLDAGEVLSRRVPGFHLDVVGDGPLRPLVEERASRSPWLSCHGSLTGEAKVDLVARASLMLMPGLVGLAVIDSFAARSPLVTTEYPHHSPEIEYLDDGVNGLVVPGEGSADQFAAAVEALLLDPGRVARLREGCVVAHARYSLDHMVERFAGGIEATLA